MVMPATPWMVMRGQARICELSLVLAVTLGAALPRLGMMIARAAGPSRSGPLARAARAPPGLP